MLKIWTFNVDGVRLFLKYKTITYNFNIQYYNTLALFLRCVCTKSENYLVLKSKTHNLGCSSQTITKFVNILRTFKINSEKRFNCRKIAFPTDKLGTKRSLPSRSVDWPIARHGKNFTWYHTYYLQCFLNINKTNYWITYFIPNNNKNHINTFSHNTKLIHKITKLHT